MSQPERPSDKELKRIAIERARQLDQDGFLVTLRYEIEASAVADLTGITLRSLRRMRDAETGPPSSRTVGTTALYRLLDVLRFIEGTQRPASEPES